MEDILLPAVTLGFQAVSSYSIYINILRESIITNIVIQLIFAVLGEPLLFLLYGILTNRHIKGFLRKKRRIQPEPVKDYESVKNHTNHEIQLEHGAESMAHESLSHSAHPTQDIRQTAIDFVQNDDINANIEPHDSLNARDKKFLLMSTRCTRIGRFTALCGAVALHISYNSHIRPKFGSVTNAVLFVDFNTNDALPSDMGAK